MERKHCCAYHTPQTGITPKITYRKDLDHMAKKRIVMALGHDALGTNLLEQKVRGCYRKINCRFHPEWWQVAAVHSNAPPGRYMIHTAKE